MFSRLFIDLFLLWLASVVQFTVGIPRSVGPFLRTAKKLYGNFLFVYLIVTLHMHNYGIQELLCACDKTFLFMYLFNSAIGVFGKRL